MILEHWSDTLLRIWDLALGPIAFTLNAVLLVLIYRHTPKAMQTFSVIIVIITICDAVCGLCRVLTSRRLYPSDVIVVMYQGFCERISDDLTTRAYFCTYWYTLETQMYMLSHVLIMISYIYRLKVITMPFDQLKRVIVYGAVIGYSYIHFLYFNWVYYMALEPMEDVNKAMIKYRPELVGSRWTYFAILYPNSPSMIVMNVAAVALVFIVLLVAAICQWRLQKSMSNFHFSENIKRLHRAQINILYAQTIGPILSLATVGIFIAVGQSDHFVLGENLTGMPILLAIIINPVVTISVVGPYRNAFLAWFGKSQVHSEQVPSVTSTTKPIETRIR